MPFLRLALLAPILLAGCTKPNAANIELRRKNQELESRLDQVQRELMTARASIKALESSATTVPVLPDERLSQLFTTHGLKIGRLTGEADLDTRKPGNEGLKIYVVPIDQHKQPLKAAGAFTVDAFDLADGRNNHLGHWEFPASKAQDHFYSMLTLYTYALPAPWQQLPKHSAITLRVTFVDALTGRTFSEQKRVEINVAATTMPADHP